MSAVLEEDHTRNGVNATQKRFVLRCSHHFWCDPKCRGLTNRSHMTAHCRL